MNKIDEVLVIDVIEASTENLYAFVKLTKIRFPWDFMFWRSFRSKREYTIEGRNVLPNLLKKKVT